MVQRPPRGYQYAALVEGKQTAQAMSERLQSGDVLPVLAEASGAIGVLRALAIRIGTPCLPGLTYTLAHYVFMEETRTWTMHLYSVERTEAA